MSIRHATWLSLLMAWILASSLLAFSIYTQRTMTSQFNISHHRGHTLTLLAMESLIHFKKQVQEWKNVLLRGDDAGDLAIFWKNFTDQEEMTYAGVEALLEALTGAPHLQAHARDFLVAHKRLGERYREAFYLYNPRKWQTVFEIDDRVRGIDREPTRQLELLVEGIAEHLNNGHEELAQSLSKNLTYILYGGGSIILIWLGLTGVLLTRWIVRPLTEATAIAGRIGKGHYDTVIASDRGGEIGTLFNALSGMQTRIRNDTAELERQREEVAEAYRRAHAADIAKGRFLSIVSHELRTPLNGISGAQQLLSLQESSLEQKEMLDIIENSSKQLLRLIDRILLYVELENVSGRDADTVGDLRFFITSLSVRYRTMAHNAGMTLTLSPENLETCDVDLPRRLIETVCRELLENAIKFAAKGEIALYCACESRPNEKLLVIAMEDHGPGIDVSIVEQLDRQFVQGDDSNTRIHGGLGLGLALCQRIAEALHGRMIFGKSEHSGARIVLELPIPTQ